ncbi:hypothetical protein CC78DRAFT_453342, partial [Lojkania enalia]
SFLWDTNRFLSEDFMPTDKDILYTRCETVGVAQKEPERRGNKYRVTDVGGAQSQRKKWIYVFPGVSKLLYTVPLSCYNEISDRLNRDSTEALTLFDTLCVSQWFSTTKIALCFTKLDVFERKIQSGRYPIPDCIQNPRYDGAPDDVEAVKSFLTERFRDLCCKNHANPEIYYINALDTVQVRDM